MREMSDKYYFSKVKIFDVGAAFGDFAREAMATIPESLDLSVVLVEPNPVYKPFLRNLLSKSQLLQAAVIPPSLFKHDKMIEFNLSRFPELSSVSSVSSSADKEIWSHHLAGLQTLKKTFVPYLTLDDLLTNTCPESLVVVKLDVQGLDLKILRESSKLAAIGVLIFECDLDSKASLMDSSNENLREVIEWIWDSGFKLHCVIPNGGGEVNIVSYSSKIEIGEWLRIFKLLGLDRSSVIKTREPSLFESLSIRLRHLITNALSRIQLTNVESQ